MLTFLAHRYKVPITIFSTSFLLATGSNLVLRNIWANLFIYFFFDTAFSGTSVTILDLTLRSSSPFGSGLMPCKSKANCLLGSKVSRWDEPPKWKVPIFSPFFTHSLPSICLRSTVETSTIPIGIKITAPSALLSASITTIPRAATWARYGWEAIQLAEESV